jgi:hypothetical protein
MSRAKHKGAHEAGAVHDESVVDAVPTDNDYPRRRTHVEKPALPSIGYRAGKRSSKGGKQARRAATAARVKAEVSETAGSVGRVITGGLKKLGIGLGAILVLALVFILVATGINEAARFLAKRHAANQNTPAAVKERAKDNLLIIGTDGINGADFLAVRLDEKTEQVFGVAVPDGAFMEVPGQGFERVGDSYRAGPEVSLAAISNYLTVPFENYIVVSKQAYQDALTEQSMVGLMAAATKSNLSAQDRADLGAFMDKVTTDKVALVPLPVKQINLGEQMYFEPQREQVADLLLQWWGVKIGSDEGVIRAIVYNGAGTPGLAGEVAQQLIKAGVRVIDTKNADKFDYKETLIVVQDGDLDAGATVKEVLGTGKIVDQPSDQDVADIIIIVGQDWKPSKG